MDNTMTDQLIKVTPATLETANTRRERYLEGMRQAENGLKNAAQAFLEMEAAGDDVSFVRYGLRQILRAIGTGKALPECYNFKGSLQRKLLCLPIEVQKEIVGGKPLALAVLKNDGVEALQVQASALEPLQIQQLFGRDSIRPLEEQRLWLEAQRVKKTRQYRTKLGDVVVDKKGRH